MPEEPRMETLGEQAQTLEELLLALGCPAAVRRLKLAGCGGWLTARIISGQCWTCRGSGLRQDLPYEGDPRCPTCHGVQPTWIVMPEAAEAGGREFWNRTRQLRVDELKDVEFDDLSPVRRIELTEEGVHIATVLLGGGVERAREVCNITSERVMLELTRIVPDDGGSVIVELHRGDRIALFDGGDDATSG